MSTTVRLFSNDNRISTAVKYSAGNIYQVYPTKNMFASEDAWREHWFNQMKPILTIKAAEPAKPAKKVKPAKLSDWDVIQRNSFKTTLPAGDYYIGDLCYVLGTDVYHNIFGGSGYSSGIYKEKNTNRIFAVASTAYGDGEYKGSDGNKFAVDAGIIGICSKDLMAKDDGGGHMYSFNYPVEIRFSGGRFSFESRHKDLVIDTSGYDSDDD